MRLDNKTRCFILFLLAVGSVVSAVVGVQSKMRLAQSNQLLVQTTIARNEVQKALLRQVGTGPSSPFSSLIWSPEAEQAEEAEFLSWSLRSLSEHGLTLSSYEQRSYVDARELQISEVTLEFDGTLKNSLTLIDDIHQKEPPIGVAELEISALPEGVQDEGATKVRIRLTLWIIVDVLENE